MEDDPKPQYWPGAAVGITVGVVTALVGYLLSVSGHDSFGVVIFCLLPFITGLSVAAIVRPKAILAACVITVGVLSAAILIATRLEGFLCVVLAAPIMAAGMAIGAVVGYLLIGRRREHERLGKGHTVLLLLLLPALMAAAERVERPLRNQQRTETFATTILVDASPEETWNSLTHIPRLSGPQPFLLAIGLPVPTHCSLGEQTLGSERVCYFDQGEIAQQVTDWQPAARLEVAITGSTLPGRRWLEFIGASYELKEVSEGTLVTRYSTIGSQLYPRWYWRGLEGWAVTSEHDYVLANIKRIAESR
ncbi:MAG: hypothetical protein KDA79_12785 [Planctomycetaceae bacterium]|nr:hypothetical protein [Planctomycetaceae bacterium]